MTDLTAKEWRRKWVEALRSGKYKQTTGTLRDRDGFCCLGVLCDISKTGEWVKDDGGWRYEGYTDVLPKPVQQLVGLRAQNGNISRSTEPELEGLSEMNDADGKSFAEIADVIEAEPEGLLG